jgi:nucleoid-associated protein YgaU
MSVAPKKSVETVRRTVQKVYVVEEGDSLSVIAKKVYGEVEGNRKVNVARIFEANRNLKSRDKIYVGQKLFIPLLPGTSFKKVETLAGKNTVEGKSRKSSGKWYVVRDGDSLWDIASEYLGNGSRYYEIVRLNTNILSDEDNLVVGMRLKLPAR